MKILFWNTNNNENINEYITCVVRDYEVDVLILAEYKSSSKLLERGLQNINAEFHSCNTIGCERIRLWSNNECVVPGLQDKRYSIQIIEDKIVMCCVHLPSDLHGDFSEERLEIIKRILYEIEEIEEIIKSRKTIIIGDLNEMPYGKGCLNANGFHALPVLKDNDNPVRVINDREYRKFYNPMWNLLGDFSYPPGTYYLNQSKIHNPMWYMLDQVILSQDIVPYFKKESLKIITTCEMGVLYNENGRPNTSISDHFPVYCEIVD